MLHFSCDLCGKDLNPDERNRFVVKMEIFPAGYNDDLVDADLDSDHLDKVAQLLREHEENSIDSVLPKQNQKLRFDLCTQCHTRFLANPLGRENTNLYFSEN